MVSILVSIIPATQAINSRRSQRLSQLSPNLNYKNRTILRKQKFLVFIHKLQKSFPTLIHPNPKSLKRYPEKSINSKKFKSENCCPYSASRTCLQDGEVRLQTKMSHFFMSQSAQGRWVSGENWTMSHNSVLFF